MISISGSTSHGGELITLKDVAPGWSGWTFKIRYAEAIGEDVPRDDVVALEVLAPENGITSQRLSDDWRRIPIGTVLGAARSWRRAPMAALLAGALGEPPIRPHGGSAEHLARVADVYRIALDQGVAPAELIAQHFNRRDLKTAQRWIKEARDHEPPFLGSYAEEKERATAYEPQRPDGSRRAPGRGSTAKATTEKNGEKE